MYEIEVKVTNIVKILTKDLKIGSNNLNTIQINFTLPDEFSGLTVLAVFTNSEEKSYKKTVTDNKCLIPFEALKEGKVTLGVYAYSGDELIYSPIATTFIVEKGSYIANSEDENVFTPSDFDLWLEQANEMYLKITELTAGLDSKVQEVEEKLENGEFTPVKGVDYWTESDKTEIITDVTDKIKPELQSINTKIDTINNDIIDIDSDIHNINTELGNKLNENNANKFINNIEYNTKTATFTFTAYDNTQIQVDLPIESTVQDGGYDKETHELYLILVSGQEIRIPVTDLVDDYTGEETVTIQVLVSSDNKITANIKGGSISENLLDENVKAKLNKVVDLTPYYTKIEVNGLLENKVDKIEGMGLSQENFTTVLKEKLGSLSIELQQGSIKNVTYNAETGVISFIKNDNSKIDIDLPLELLVESGIYDEGNKQIVLTLANGNVINIPLSDLLDDLYTKSEVDAMVSKLENENEYQNQIIDQFQKEFEEGTAEGENIHITDSAELPMVLEPHGNLKQEVIEAVEGSTVEGENITVTDVDTTKEFNLNYLGNSKQEQREGYNKLNFKKWIDSGIAVKNGTLNNYNEKEITLTTTENDCFIDTLSDSSVPSYNQEIIEKYGSPINKTQYSLSCLKNNNSNSRLIVTFFDEAYNYLGIKESQATNLRHIYNFEVLENTKYITYRFGLLNNDVGTQVTFSEMMLLEGTYTEETLPKFEKFGKTPSIEFKSPVENVKGDINIELGNVDNTLTQAYTLHLGDLELNGIGDIRDSFVVELEDYFSSEKVIKKLYKKEIFEPEQLFTGNENWVLYNNPAGNQIDVNRFYISKNTTGLQTTDMNIISNKIKNTIASNAWTSNEECIAQSSSQIILLINKEIALDVESLKQFLIENNISYICRKDEELIDLTNDYPELVQDIENIINNSELYEGVTNIITSGNLVIELDYNYITPSPSTKRPSEIHYVEGNNEIEIRNKNYFTLENKIRKSGISQSGINFEIDKNKVKINGTTTIFGNMTLDENQLLFYLQPGKYIISCNKSGSYNVGTGDCAFYIRKSISPLISLFSVTHYNNYTLSSVVEVEEKTPIYFNSFSNLAGQVFTDFEIEFQIERIEQESDEATEIIEPQSQNLSLTLPDDIKLYGKEDGFVYLTDGSDGEGWYVYNEWGEFIVTGNESETDFILESSGRFLVKNTILPNLLKNSSNDNLTGAFCNQFTELTANQTSTKNEGFSVDSGGNLNFYSKEYAGDLEAFKEIIRNNNIKVIAPLQTPTYTKITDDTLITQLEALKKVFSYYPVTNVDSVSENAPIYFNVDYLKSNKITLKVIQEQIEDIKQQISNT